MLKYGKRQGELSMDKPTSSAERTDERASPQDLKHLQHLIAIASTQTRIKWELPASTEPELQACGRLGLAQAIARFDASRGASLRTYAEPRIRGAIKNGAKALYRTRRRGALHSQVRETDTGDKWERAIDFFEEVALGASVAAAYESQAVRDLHETPEDRMIREEEWGRAHRALAALDERSRHALKRLYVDEAPGTEVAKELGVHPSNITRLKGKALLELQALVLADDDAT
jgi:RNA polymerase sigma factor (sigma-70 family)